MKPAHIGWRPVDVPENRVMTETRSPAAIERGADLEHAKRDAEVILAATTKPGTFERQAQDVVRVALARAERLTKKLDAFEMKLRRAGIDPDA